MSEYAIPVDEAMKRLKIIPDYDAGDGPEPCVHTFRDTGVALLGAHWSVVDLRALMEKYGVEEAGDGARSMGHSLVVKDPDPLFIETTS